MFIPANQALVLTLGVRRDRTSEKLLEKLTLPKLKTH